MVWKLQSTNLKVAYSQKVFHCSSISKKNVSNHYPEYIFLYIEKLSEIKPPLPDKAL